MTSTNQETTFLDIIKAELIAKNVNLSVNLEEELAHVLREVPEMAKVLIGYFTTNTPQLTDDPATFDSACALLGVIQQRMDYASYQYERIHPLYNAIKEQRDNISQFALLNINDLKTLKTVDMRDAALGYILKEHNRFLTKLDEIYSLIASVKENLKSAHFTIKLQLDLINCKVNQHRGAGQIASAPGSAGYGRQ